MMNTTNQNDDKILDAPVPVSGLILATSFLRTMFQFFRQTELHDSSNAIFVQANQEVLRTLSGLMMLPGQSGIHLTFKGELFFINGVRLRPQPRLFYIYRYLLRYFRSRKIGGIKVLALPTEKSLSVFLSLISKVDKEENPAQEIYNHLVSEGIREFELIPLSGQLEKSTNEQGEGDVELIVASLYQRLQKFVEVCFDNMERAYSFSLKPVQESLNELILLAEGDIVQMLRLISVKRYERPLPFRAVNSCFMVMAWARSLRLPAGVVTELGGAALAHPIAILSGKPGTVPEVLATIQKLKDTWQLTDLQRLSVLEWTRPFGKTGVYETQGVKSYQHFFSRMIRIVALFEEMTTYEAGKRVFLPDEALAELLKNSHDCDPTLLKLFVNWVGVYPVGSLVQLQSGEVAQVFAGASDPLRFQRPIVSVLKSANGKLLERPQLLDLSEMNEKLGVYKRNIKRSITLEEANIPPDYFQLNPVGVT
ncbi:MAG: hypothetical protein J0L93_06210 [Deltaproteobacteria bacterium]|nr:hypothetical protein [Deltaproteobacteria bacterium]